MRVCFERDFPVPPKVLWPWLTDPARMQQWSAAPVELVSCGPCGRPDGVGSHRLVRVGLGPLRSGLLEEIMQSQPPHHFVYRVVSGGGLRQHEGTIDIEANGASCRMRWVVEYQTWMPGLGLPIKWLLEHQLDSSLQALRVLVEAALPGESPGPLDSTRQGAGSR